MSEEQFPPIYKKEKHMKITEYKTRITQQDQLLFDELDHFLNGHNNEQKKAIISNKNQILCIEFN